MEWELGGIKLMRKEVERLRECLELLRSIESIEYHNKNWLATFATNNPKALSEEKMNLIESAIEVIGTSATKKFT